MVPDDDKTCRHICLYEFVVITCFSFEAEHKVFVLLFMLNIVYCSKFLESSITILKPCVNQYPCVDLL